MGEEERAPDPLASLHLEAWALLKNGTGGMDWAGLPYVIEHLGLTDADVLIEALKTIKTYTPPK